METSSLPEQRCREESFPLFDSPLWLAGKGHRPLTSLCLCSIDGKDPDFPGHRRCFIALKSAWRGSPWPGRSHISRKSPHCDAAFVVEHCPGYFFSCNITKIPKAQNNTWWRYCSLPISVRPVSIYSFQLLFFWLPCRHRYLISAQIYITSADGRCHEKHATGQLYLPRAKSSGSLEIT